MARFVSEFKELEIGNVRFNKGFYATNDPAEIDFLEKMEALRRYRIKRIDPKVAESPKDKKKD